MYDCMISYVYNMYMSIDVYVVIWLHECMNICVMYVLYYVRL